MFSQENASVDYIRMLITAQQLGHNTAKNSKPNFKQTRGKRPEVEGFEGSSYTVFVNTNEWT